MKHVPGSVILTLILWVASCASTPPIIDHRGRPVPESIAVLEQVQLNGRQEWVTIRGRNAQAPLLLYLAGGPGGSELATARRLLGGLEDAFVLVVWDQPGAGKSYGALPHRDLTLEVFLEDGEALIDQLLSRFHQDKVLLVGESWGSFLGVMLAARCPEKVAGLVGTGQMVAFLENDLACYQLILDWSRSTGDQKKVEELTRQGPPPYQGPGVARKLSAFLMETSRYMCQTSHVRSSGILLSDMMGRSTTFSTKSVGFLA